MTTKTPSDFTNLAKEALDLWQEHLTALASDPKAKADLAQVLEPSRRLFAEWMEKAQNAAHGHASFVPATTNPTGNPKDRAPPAGLASDDGTLRLAQLALHVAELEKRVANLESRKPRAAGKTTGAAKRPSKS